MNNKAEAFARKGHEIYERLAPEYGYETRQDTKEFDPDSPNGKLMIAVYCEMLNECAEVAREAFDKAEYFSFSKMEAKEIINEAFGVGDEQ